MYTLRGLASIGFGWNGPVFPMNIEGRALVILEFRGDKIATDSSYNRLSESITFIPIQLNTSLRNPPDALPEYTTSIYFDGIGALTLMNLTNVTYSVTQN